MKFKATKSFDKPYIPSGILGLYQEGGAMVQGEPENMGGGEDPMAQLLMMAQQAVESGDGEMALQVCQVLVEMAGQMEGGAPEEAPMEQPPM